VTAADDVVRRWHPHGWRRLHEPGPGTVRATGVPGSGTGSLVDELRQVGGLDLVRDGSAPVVLFVLDPSAVLGRTELDLLAEVAATATEVVCALTGIDRYADWRSVRDRDTELLHRHAPWLPRVTVLPVSSDLARRARDVGGDTGAVLLASAGIVELRDVLVAAVESASDPRRARAAVISRTRRMIVDELDALRHGDDTAGLRAERLRLATSPMPTVRRPDLQRARIELLQEVAGQVRGVSQVMREVLDDPSCSPDEIAATLSSHVGHVHARIAAALAAHAGRDLAASDAVAPDVFAAPLPGRGRALEDTLTLVLGASAGAGLGRLLVTPFGEIPAAVALLVAVAGAAPAAWGLTHVRRRIAYRDRMRRWVGDELITVRADLEAWVRARIFEVEARAAATAESTRGARVARLRERAAALDEEIRRRTGERLARVAACERDLATLGSPVEPSARGVRRTGKEHDRARFGGET